MRYIVGFLVTIGLIIFVIFLLARGGSPAKQPLYLPDYAGTNAVARFTIDGPISSPQTHDIVQISVGKDAATINVLKGYENDVVSSKTYDMGDSAYDVFLHALQHAGFTQGNDDSNASDERGYCPTGDRYIYEMINDDEHILRYWYTTCHNGTFKGSAPLIQELFKAQIPDYYDLTSRLNL